MNDDKSESAPAPEPPRRSIARSAGIVSIAVMGSRILGLVREQVFAAFFGSGFAMDAYRIAFRIPNLLRDLFAEGALSSAFVATFSRTITLRGEKEAWRLANLVSNALVVLLTLIVLLGIVFAPQIVDVFIDQGRNLKSAGNASLTVPLAVTMTRILFPFLLMISLAAVAMGVLNTKERYGVPASASTMFNVGSIFGGLICASLMAPEYITATLRAALHGRKLPEDIEGASAAIIGMAIGTLIGGMLQWLMQVPSLRAVGYRWQPVLSLKDEGMRQVMRLMAPAMIGSAALQVNIAVNTGFATSLGEGVVSWLDYAFRLIYLPIGMFGVAISTATLPLTSRAAALENLDEFRRTVALALRLTLLMTIPSAVGLIVLSRPIIALIYQHGRFSAHDTEQTAIALACNAIGLTAYSAVRVLAPSFYALKDTRIPMMASLLSIVTNYVVVKLLIDSMGAGIRGLALALPAVTLVNFGLLFYFMRRKLGGLEVRSLLATFFKVLLASLVMGAICWFLNQEIELRLGTGGTAARLAAVGVPVLVGMAVFFGAARLLRVREMEQFTASLRRKFLRK
ncbi:MAG: murein biosynthesis integral membrane protein MurJ [Blastocatellia bacterium]